MRLMPSRFLRYSLGLALLPALLAPGVAFAEDSDLSRRVDALEVGNVVNAENVDALTGDVSRLDDELSTLNETQAQLLAEVQGLREDGRQTVLTVEEHEALMGMSGNLQKLAADGDAVEPDAVEDPETQPYMTLDGIGQLLMLNTACTAIMVGVLAFSNLWRSIGGE